MSEKNRRQEYAETTRQALLAAARDLFARDGYAETSIDDIARHERLTKGALYHHFKNKKELFEAVVDDCLGAMAAKVAAAFQQAADPWDRAITALDAFLDGCLDPDYQRIVIQEAPAVLGWGAWREKEQRSGMALVTALLEDLAAAGHIRRQPVELAGRILVAAIMEVALAITHSADPAATRQDARRILERMIHAL
ncbi:MAG TPA: helix-turn-helix domain-containing protein [Herpetosiphonaceae bacterium]|nr:helix-turn-helix domain-containing protein [Herpetosiphonaceae bacterium]